MRNQLLAAASLALLVLGSVVAADDDLLKELLAQETKVYEALKNKDHATVAKMLDQQHYAVLPEIGRLPLSKVLKLDSTINSYEISDAKAIPVHQDCAILSYKYTWSGTRLGKEAKNLTSFATSVWSKRDGEWRAVFYQETPE